jgi:hypothetical protein
VNKTSFLLLGATIGAGFALALTYLLGPADRTTYDENYRSRLDFALEQGKLAGQEREEALRRQLTDLTQRPSGSVGKG